jgi:hypothetical protein
LNRDFNSGLHEATFNIFIRMELKLFFLSTETKAPLGACADSVENNSFKLLIAPGVVFHGVAPSEIKCW